MTALATLAQPAVSCFPARQYMMKLMKVTRIMRLATVILADMTPKTPSKRMVRAAHLPGLLQTGDERVRRHPDAEAQQQNDQHRHDRLPILHLRTQGCDG